MFLGTTCWIGDIGKKYPDPHIVNACDNCPDVWDATSQCHGPCEGDFDGDGDVDGSDLAVFAAGGTGVSLEEFAAEFGRTDC